MKVGAIRGKLVNMVEKQINQGEIYWLDLGDDNPFGAEHPHPYVVIQDDVINHSRVETVVLCALTTNMKKVNLPGNVLLESGEANLPKQSIVVVSQVVSVQKTALGGIHRHAQQKAHRANSRGVETLTKNEPTLTT